MARDEEKFTLLYQTYYADLFRFAFSYLHNQGEAEDVVQDVFLELFLHPLKDEKNLKSWLFTCAANKAKNELRRRKREEESMKQATLAAENQESCGESQIMDRIENLPDKYKEIILLHYIAGLDIDELARTLKISRTGAKKRIERARAMLKEEKGGKKP